MKEKRFYLFIFTFSNEHAFPLLFTRGPQITRPAVSPGTSRAPTGPNNIMIAVVALSFITNAKFHNNIVTIGETDYRRSKIRSKIAE